MRKTTIKVIVTLLILSVFSFGLFANGSSETSDSEIVIGCIQDTSGPTSALGKMVQEGAELALANINANGGIDGKTIRMITYDSKADVNESINAYTRAVTTDHVSAIIGPPIANIVLAIAPISEKYDVPFLNFAIDPKCQTKQDGTPYKNMFGMKPSSVQLGAYMADYAVNTAGFKNIGVIYNESNAYSISLLDPFTNVVEADGGTIVEKVSYNANDKDFKTLLSRIVDSNADAIYSPSYPQELVLIAQQAREMGYKGTLILGLDAAPPFNTLLGQSADDIFFINNFDDTTDEIKAISKEVLETKGITTTGKFYLGYDAAQILAQAFREVGTNSADVRDYVENLNRFEGITGITTMDPATHFPKEYELLMYTYDNIEPVVLEHYLSEVK